MARRRQSRQPSAGLPPLDSQPALAAPQFDAGDDGSRQVGISVVRHLGPGVPLRGLCLDRRPVCQGPAPRAALRAIPASQRADTGLRVGFLRSQSARSRLGRVAGLQHGPRPQRQGRPRFPRALLPQAADQFHVVGQQGRSHGQQHLRGRVPGARQRGGLRSQPADEQRRRARTGRCHRLDGDVLPGPDADRPGVGQGGPDLRGPGDEVLPALCLCGVGHETHGRPRLPALGRKGRLLLRRPAVSGRALREAPRPNRW